jgi:hypothetical protein
VIVGGDFCIAADALAIGRDDNSKR